MNFKAADIPERDPPHGCPAQSVVIMGVSGSGKSTVGRLLAEKMGADFFDADDFHPESNKKKMSAGEPLTDEDRAGWLGRLSAMLKNQRELKRKTVLACSALKHSYRDTLRQGDQTILWVYLKGSEQLIRERLKARTGHFMNPLLLSSQFATLEEPEDALICDIGDIPELIVEKLLVAAQLSA